MSHQIYYTSAPEGLRPGQSGFCTVATTEGIPRPLWDRLESVSGYRHEFSAGSGGSNPVAYAHWLLAVQGRELSVLSRISDSGLDYTQRTNAFAHHIALESSERAAAGPAWMLSRPGLMAGRWDGRVGAIPSASLPSGDVRPAPCNAWQRLTGDAGWGGVLAEAGVKYPRRPVCILFSPGQEVLPLIAEAIALLPAPKRWDVTFNTYFTGLPGNVVCAWRCCLAGTPAASDAVRHATGGLVIDLTRAGDLGTPPAGAWVDAARSGRGPTSAAPAIAVRPTVTRSRSLRPAQVEPLEVVPIEETAPLALAGKPLADVFNDDDDFATPTAPQSAGETRAVDRSWIDQQRQSRRTLLIAVAVVALLFVAAGVWLRTSANRATAERPLEVPATTEVIDPAPPPLKFDPDPPPVVKVTPSPVTRPKAPVTVDKPPVEPAPTPEPVKPLPPPQAIDLLTEVLQPVTAGAALRAPTQTIVIPAEQFDDLPGLASFRIAFPGETAEYAYRQKELAGVLTPEPAGDFRHQLIWRDDANRAVPVDVALVSLERNGGGTATLEIVWRMNALLKRPEVISLTRVLLQTAGFVVAGPQDRRPQPIRFKPLEPIDIDLSSAEAARLGLSPLPGAICRQDKSSDEGWKVQWKPQAADRGAAVSEADAGVLSFQQANSLGGEPATFEVRIGPGWSTATSDFAPRKEAAGKAAAAASAALAKVDEEIDRLQTAQRMAMKPIETRIAEAQAALKLSDAELANRFTNKTALRELIKGERERLTQTRKAWQPDIEKATEKREPAESAQAVAAETLAAFERFKAMQIAIELPGKLKVATLRLKAP